jgi:phage N-6-adenine-methyltransferase
MMDAATQAVMFSKASDEWETPQHLFDALHQEFVFVLDAAATSSNAKCVSYYTRTVDALTADWRSANGSVWLNPPYSQCAEFVAKAHSESLLGVTTVALLHARTDTRWWHDYVWQTERHLPRNGVEVRFVRGRLRFSGAKHSAPFPSVVVVFYGRA